MAEPTGNITGGGGGVSSWLTPDLVSNLIQFAPALLQRRTGRDQAREAEKMQQALGPRINYAIPGSAKRALGVAEDLARPRTMAGQDYMQYMMDLENAKAFGRASKAATSSQDLLGVATQLGEAGQENQLDLGVKAAEDYNKRQKDLATALGVMAGFEDKVTADRQVDWYERANAAAAMKEAAMKNRMGGLQGLIQAGTQLLGSDAAKQLFNKIGSGDDTRDPIGDIPLIESRAATQLPMSPDQRDLMTSSNILGRKTFFGPDNMSGNTSFQFPVNQNGLMPTTTISGRTFFPQQMSSLPAAQLPVNQTGLMPTTSLKDVFNMFNLYQGKWK
jgi:hypothetical protein